MITERPAIDWLTLTTFEMRTQKQAMSWLRNFGTPKENDLKMPRYEGIGGLGWFVGDGQQSGKTHHMVRLTGELSDKFMFDKKKPSGMDCTRLDIQLTLPYHRNIEKRVTDARNFSDALAAHERQAGQRARSINPIIPPDDGEFTIYIGTRQGTQRFYRLYVKETDEGPFLRFEAEFKDKSGLAGRAYREINKEPEKMVTYLAGELATLPDHQLIDPFKRHLAGIPGDIMKLERRRADPHKTLRWLKKQVMPAFKRLLGHDHTRVYALGMLNDLMDFARGLE